jgi:hypothetical protein
MRNNVLDKRIAGRYCSWLTAYQLIITNHSVLYRQPRSGLTSGQRAVCRIVERNIGRTRMMMSYDANLPAIVEHVS